jgi:hypothetical protein
VATIQPSALTAAVLALSLAGAAWAGPAPIPRAADGHPDLSGVWTNASVTHLTRAPGVAKLVLSPAEAAAYEKNDGLVRRLENDARPSDAAAGAPAKGDPGGYNTFWLDPGIKLGVVKGEVRTSWIVEPPDGQLPLTPEGRRKVAEARKFAQAADTPAGPESLEPWDRCIISSRGSGGPGMLNNIYNSNYQIVQTPGFVTIVIEMVHDARAIPVFPTKAAAQAGHGPAALHPWLGDSTAWWDGPALNIETVNVNAEQGRAGPIFLTPRGRVTERLTRVAKDQILYEFEVEDPTYYTRPWRAEMTLRAGPKQLYEYACHEGNYALVGILRATRQEEAKAGGANTGGR